MSEGFDPGQIVYRMAYGEACRLAEEHRRSVDWQDTSPAVTARILGAVARRLERDTADPDVIEGVEDAIAGRRPRW